MSNALGTLFSDIANAIRGKNGETGTMKPAEFPGKISAIETGGGVEVADGVLFATGLFTPTETPATVTHGLGLIPDMVAVFCLESPATTSALVNTTGFSEAWTAAGYLGNIYTGSFHSTSMSRPVTGTIGFGEVGGATATTFRVGNPSGDPGELSIGKAYRWIAISGDGGVAWKTVQLSDYLTGDTTSGSTQSKTYVVECGDGYTVGDKSAQHISGAAWSNADVSALDQTMAVFDIADIADGADSLYILSQVHYTASAISGQSTDVRQILLHWFDAAGQLLLKEYAYSSYGKLQAGTGLFAGCGKTVTPPEGAAYLGVCLYFPGNALKGTDVTDVYTKLTVTAKYTV